MGDNEKVLITLLQELGYEVEIHNDIMTLYKDHVMQPNRYLTWNLIFEALNKFSLNDNLKNCGDFLYRFSLYFHEEIKKKDGTLFMNSETQLLYQLCRCIRERNLYIIARAILKARGINIEDLENQ